MTAPAPTLAESRRDEPDYLIHIVCRPCLELFKEGKTDWLISFCGVDLTNEGEVPPGDYGPDDCVVCEELQAYPCPMCGKKLS